MSKRIKHQKRKLSIRSRLQREVTGYVLSVFRSNKHIYGYVHDNKGKVLFSASSLKLKNKNKIEDANEVGLLVSKMMKDNEIKKVTFDRSGYKYHGRVKALVESVRQNNIII